MPLLSRTSEYALRAVVVLSKLPPGGMSRAADLAEETGIPVHYLSKIMRKLGVAKLVQAHRGHGGGFRLHRPPSAISLQDVLLAVADSVPSHCVFGWARCSDSAPCPLHPAWIRLKNQFEQWASTTTLADLD